jgi:hypothetical protein
MVSIPPNDTICTTPLQRTAPLQLSLSTIHHRLCPFHRILEGVMDTEYSFIPVRKYQTPVEDVELESLPSPTSRQQPLFSAFERLPVELRQRVYSFLGYPVGGKVWMDVPGRNFSCDWLYTPARVKIAYFDLWRWDATLLSQGFPQGIRAYLDHPRLSDKIWNFEVCKHNILWYLL